ncbi:unnamed protein product [Rotaria sordida]|uniref:Poly [ADP-ribose] polymerase n=1 Tax=Rotaria sordida TaxID=392033 RepID=A0A814B9T8_9BILA|nr:unnamed protein product [Rotaria sordida]
MSPLNGKTFVLELGRDIRFKAKQELINYLHKQNAHISYILTASTDYVLVSNDIDTYKTRRAKQFGIPLVNVEYIYEYRKLPNENNSIDIKRFIITSAEDKENFSKSGTISITDGGNPFGSIIKPVKLDLSKIKIWNSDDVKLPRFDELTHAEISKWAIFKETNENSDVYFVLEVQIIPEEYNNQTNNDYRLRFRYEKQTITNLKGKISLIQYAFSHDINELHQLYASYYNRIVTMPRITRIRDLLPDKLGSKLLLRSLFLHRIDTQMLDDNVCQLVESLWIESIGDLNKILSIQPETIALKTIIEAEAALLEIKSDSKSPLEAETRFYSLIPHQQSFVIDLINNRRALIDKLDLCQMLRDMITINELTNWNIKASIEAKYRALKCHIETVKNDTHEYATISKMISSSTNSNEQVIIHQIYSVAKQTDALNFRSTFFNQKQLFHGSKYNNFLGILSRGLLMPKMVVNDLGVTRTDIGCLGYGLYFSDSVSTSLKYTKPSITRSDRRLLCISQVALGDSAKFYSYAPNLIQPPEHFHSTHGVKRNDENNSKFSDDEYVIYNLDQQRLLYLVELSWIPYDNMNQSPKLLPIIRDYLTNQSKLLSDEVDIPSTIEDEVIQVAEQDYGLICPSSGEVVPLKAFHIRAQLVDITAEIVLYQVYHNSNSIPIEAKYVFPLDENSSVCGFEAHINNKIIKGVVKEKEQAKREYREAIEKGYGAYLMHQEQPEVFSVSVGNLPANCEVIIKITYVVELSIENNDIIFRLPAKVASWQSKQALEIKDQTILPSINLEQDNSSMKSVEFSLKASIRMPYEITKLFSPTHRLRRKITDCLAMIELVDNILLEKDFILSITLKSVNLPRMLNETFVLSDTNTNNQLIDENSQACMLTFYPKFEMINNSNEYVEIIFIIDVSNSMDGKHIQQAKQLAHLFLTNMKTDDKNIFFNIVTFGSDNDECFPISSQNTKENIDKAKHFVLHSLDHRGNTDLFSVLRQYSLLPSSSKLGRQFILLSDGHINDLQSILILLENRSSMRYDRLFTCSIGETSNKHNLRQLSNGINGGGLITVFDSNYRSRWKTKVLQILEHIHQPCVTNISIDWHGTIDDQQEKFTSQAPKIIRSLFNGMRLTVYRFIQNCHKATLTATINNQEYITTVFSNKITETRGRILHCLTARAIIQDYENGLLHNDECENELIKKQYKQDLIELSIKYSVVSSFTSFVAIEERDGQALETGVRLLDVMLENNIDLLSYIGWDGDRSQIDIIKDKLINGKRLFDSASIANKIDLLNEYENLCQNISYRFGGDAKYDLMLTIINTYRTTFKQKEKARELEENMQKDLMNEIKNATTDEIKILEKRLDEIDIRLGTEMLKDLEHRNTTVEEKEEEEEEEENYSLVEDDDGIYYSDEDGGDLFMKGYNKLSFDFGLDEVKNDSLRMMSFQAVNYDLLECSEIKSVQNEECEESEAGMSFGLFDDYEVPMEVHTKSENLIMNVTSEKTEGRIWSFDEALEEEANSYEIDADPSLFQLMEPIAYDEVKTLKAKKSIQEVKEYSKKQIASPVLSKFALKKAQVHEKSSAIHANVLGGEISPRAEIPSESRERSSIRQYTSSDHGLQEQQQQQQQQQMTSSDSSGFTHTSCLSNEKMVAPQMAQISDSKFNAPVGYQASNDATITTAATLPLPSFGVPFASNPFGTTTVSGNVSNNASFGSTGFGAATLPLPSFGVPFAFNPFGTTTVSGNVSNNASFGSTGFGASTISSPFGFQPSVFSPASYGFTFGSNVSYNTNNNINAPSMLGGYGGSAMFSGAPSRLPPPLPPPVPPPSSALFGSSSSNYNTNTSFMTPNFIIQQSAMCPWSPPPRPTTEELPLSSTSSESRSLFSFGGSGENTVCNAAPSMISNQSIFNIPSTSSVLSAPLSFGYVSETPKPSSIESTAASSSRSMLLRSTEILPDVDKIQTESDKPNSTVQQKESIYRDRAVEQSSKLHAASRICAPQMRRKAELDKFSEFVNQFKSASEAKPVVHKSPVSCMRYTDTRFDEQTEPTVTSTFKESYSNSPAQIDLLSKNKLEKKCKSSSKNDVKDTALLLLDVTPLSLGIEDINGHMCIIIRRNTTIPFRTQFDSCFTNAYAYQTTATIRIFSGEHKLTKYNIFLGEFILTDLIPNFASQTLEISIFMDIDCNGLLQVEAEEIRSGAKTKFRINSQNYPCDKNDIERHLSYVESNQDFHAVWVGDRQPNDSLYMLKGETTNEKINFTCESEIFKGFSTFNKLKQIYLTSMMINEFKRIQLTNGSFDLNQDLANLLSLDMKDFVELKIYLNKQGFNSFALNIQNDIIHLIATGIILLELLLQVPKSERNIFLVPFDSEQIRSILHHHLPKPLLENIDKAIDYYKQKRLCYGIYCEQLELNYSSWEKFIQYALFHINN